MAGIHFSLQLPGNHWIFMTCLVENFTHIGVYLIVHVIGKRKILSTTKNHGSGFKKKK